MILKSYTNSKTFEHYYSVSELGAFIRRDMTLEECASAAFFKAIRKIKELEKALGDFDLDDFKIMKDKSI